MKNLFLITDGGKLRKSGALVDKVEEALVNAEGTIGWVQLREQVPPSDFQFADPASDDEVLHIASELAPICSRNGAVLLINRRPDLAKAITGAGVHLSRLGAYIETARDVLGYTRLIGFSAHSVREVLEAEARGVDYVTISPIFKPISKLLPTATLGLESLRELRKHTKIQCFALGGITLENARSCVENGASGVAVLTSILLVADVGLAARNFASVMRV